MRSIFGFLLVGFVATAISFSCFSKELKIGYVDIFKVFNEYAKTKDYDQRLEKDKGEIEKTLDAKKEDIKKSRDKLSLLKEDKRIEEEEKLKTQVTEYQELERKALTDIKKERDERMKEIIEDINKVVEEYAKKNSFDLIINQNAILYGDKVMDVTTDILNISDQKYKGK